MLHAINKIFLTTDQINDIVLELSKKIEKDYEDYKEVICIIVLDGAKNFGEDLLKKLSDKFRPFFIKAKSYKGKESSEEIKVDMRHITSMANKDILLIDDIYDTGKTLSVILKYLHALRYKTLKTCVLLSRDNHQKKIEINYIGKKIYHNDFLVGYGLDWDGEYRDWKHIVRVYEDDHTKQIKEIIKGKKI